MSKNIVIVESPAKAKTIEGYLGKDYVVKSSYGHVRDLPKGLDTRVGERGLKLSGGEKQRIGIARVILSDPAVLVLDEATSALDSATEAAVQSALDEASRGRTTVMVAHRLSTVQHADAILVIRDGRIIERGNHEKLLLASGEYAAMWSRQAARDKLVSAAE